MFLFSILTTIGTAIVDALPGMALGWDNLPVSATSANFSGRLLTRLSYTGEDRAWLSRETLPTTRRLVACAIWLFALAMAYPYLPGAQTDAFKGLSVLLGLDGVTRIKHRRAGAAGLILTCAYTNDPPRRIRAHRRARGNGGRDGYVYDPYSHRSGRGADLPNPMITAAVTKNYSRTVQGPGYIIDTTVTIGYDTPWRQVEAMLIEAARRTAGILMEPSPVVFQTALADHYPAYRLVAQAVPGKAAAARRGVVAAACQYSGCFHEYGVQIMSPHYVCDPPDAKIVSPDG